MKSSSLQDVTMLQNVSIQCTQKIHAATVIEKEGEIENATSILEAFKSTFSYL